MKKPVVVEVFEWVAQHREELLDFSEVRFRFANAVSNTGKAILEIDASRIAASFTFWNRELVEALLLDVSTKETRILDDRKLREDDDVSYLLTKYLAALRKQVS